MLTIRESIISIINDEFQHNLMDNNINSKKQQFKKIFILNLNICTSD